MDNRNQYHRHPLAPIPHISAYLTRSRCIDTYPQVQQTWHNSIMITNSTKLVQSQAYNNSSNNSSNGSLSISSISNNSSNSSSNSTIISPLLNITVEEEIALQMEIIKTNIREYYQQQAQVCYIYDTAGISDIYVKPVDKLYHLLNVKQYNYDQLYKNMCEKPNWFEVQYFRRIWKYYQIMYVKKANDLHLQQRMMFRIFGQSSENLKNFIKTHIQNKQPLKLQQKQIPTHQIQYYENALSFMRQNNQKNRTKFTGTFKKISQLQLPTQFFTLAQQCIKLRVHYGDDQLQGLFNMARTFGEIYRFKILGNNLNNNSNQLMHIKNSIKQSNNNKKRVLIKCDIVQQKSRQINQSNHQQQTDKFHQTNSFQNITMKLYNLVESSTKKSFGNSQNKYNDLTNMKITFYTQICSQLIEYELLTGRQYPQLNPANILYNTKTKSFTLSPEPIIYENLAISQSQDLSTVIINNSNINSANKRIITKQANLQRQFSLNGLIKNTNPHSNAMRFLLLLHYIENQNFNIKLTNISKENNQVNINDIRFWCRLLFDQNQQQISRQFNNMNNLSISSFNIVTHLLDQKLLTMYIIAQFLKAQKVDVFPNIFFFSQVLSQSTAAFDYDHNSMESGMHPRNLLVNVSSLSGSRYQNLLHTRLKIIDYLIRKLKQTRDILSKFNIKNSAQHQRQDDEYQQQNQKSPTKSAKQQSIKLQLPSNVTSQQVKQLKNQLMRCLLVYYVLLCLTGLELVEICKKQDFIKQEKLKGIWEIIDKAFYGYKITKRIQKLTNIQKYSKSWNNLASELIPILTKLYYIYNIHKKSMQNDKIYNSCTLPHAMYSKLFYKIINYNSCCWTSSSNLKQQHPQLFCEKCQKSYKNIWQTNQKQYHTLRFICQIYRISNTLLLKMDDKNLLFCQYKIYRRMKEFMKMKQINAGILSSLEDQVQKMETGVDGAAEGRFWGFLWPKDQEDFSLMYNFYDQNNKNGNIVLQDNEDIQ